MLFFLSNQSPKTPAIGERSNLGKIVIERIDAKMVALPVRESTYNDRANCNMLLPKSDDNLPNINREKSLRLSNFVLIVASYLFDLSILYVFKHKMSIKKLDNYLIF